MAKLVVYTTVRNMSVGPFREISIDPLPYIFIKPYPGSQTKVKAFLLLIKCINSSAIEVMLMETMDTKQVILCLLRLENRYGKIIAISETIPNGVQDSSRNS